MLVIKKYNFLENNSSKNSRLSTFIYLINVESLEFCRNNSSKNYTFIYNNLILFYNLWNSSIRFAHLRILD